MIRSKIDQGSYVRISKQLIYKLRGRANEALILSELISMHTYLEGKGKLQEGGWFHQTVDYLEDTLGISAYKQRAGLSALERMNLVEVSRRGIPARRFVRLQADNIWALLKDDASQIPRIVKISRATKKIKKESFYSEFQRKIHSSNPRDVLEIPNCNIKERTLLFIKACDMKISKEFGEFIWDGRLLGRVTTWFRGRGLESKTIDYSSFVPRLGRKFESAFACLQQTLEDYDDIPEVEPSMALTFKKLNDIYHSHIKENVQI